MKYRQLSKFEINKLVAEKLGMNTRKDDLPANTLSNGYNERYPSTVWACKPKKAWEQFCFTNDSESWGELIREFSINIKFDSCQVHVVSYFADCKPVSMSHSDMGLAICIAFLEMKDWQESQSI